VLPEGRLLTPLGRLAQVGNFPSGAAVTGDGRFLWTVSAGFSYNDVRIVSLSDASVLQTVRIPGSSGGVALDSAT
jgi:hypothetical protein